MGFCDAAPGAPKTLRVRFWWHGRPYAATIADMVRHVGTAVMV